VLAAGMLFLIAQSLSIFHAQKYGDDAHTHNGVQCLFSSALIDDDNGLASVFFIILPIALLTLLALSPAHIPARVKSDTRYDPRAPPQA